MGVEKSRPRFLGQRIVSVVLLVLTARQVWGDPCACAPEPRFGHLGCYPAVELDSVPVCYVDNPENCSSVIGVRMDNDTNKLIGWRTCTDQYKQETALFEAAMQNNVSAIGDLIAEGVDVNAQRGLEEGPFPATPSHVAVLHGSFEAIDLLLFSGGMPAPLFCGGNTNVESALCSLGGSERCKDAEIRGRMVDLLNHLYQKNIYMVDECFAFGGRFAAALGGYPADCGRVPYFASLRVPLYHDHLCGGVVVGPNHVLTAASCVDPATSVLGATLPVLFIGRNFVEENNVTDDTVCKFFQLRRAIGMELHPKWDRQFGNGFDLALLKLDRGFLPSILLPGARAPSAGTELSFLGSGRTSARGGFSSSLQQITVPVQTKSKCEKVYRRSLGKNTLCVGGEGPDVCEGDEGGPLFKDGGEPRLDELVGIANKRSGSFECGTLGVASLYSAVSPEVVKWIKGFINK